MKRKIFLLYLIVYGTILVAIPEYELLKYDVRFGIINAGHGELSIEEAVYRDSIPVYNIVFRARTNSFFDRIYKVRDEISSVWHREKRISLKFHKKLREGSYRQLRTHYFYPDRSLTVYFDYNYRKQKQSQKKFEILENTQDVLSSLYYFRDREIEVGQTYKVNVTSDGRNYQAQVLVHRTEEIDSILGRRKCFLVEPILKGDAIFRQTASIYIWLTADMSHIPVKVQSKIVYGSFYAELSGMKTGR